jgi:hypothetical protein
MAAPMNVTEAAVRARVRRGAVLAAIGSGDLRALKLGRGDAYTLTESDVDLWRRSQNIAAILGHC